MGVAKQLLQGFHPGQGVIVRGLGAAETEHRVHIDEVAGYGVPSVQPPDIEPVTMILENGTHATGTGEIAAFKDKGGHARRLRPDSIGGKPEIQRIYSGILRIEMVASCPR